MNTELSFPFRRTTTESFFSVMNRCDTADERQREKEKTTERKQESSITTRYRRQTKGATGARTRDGKERDSGNWRSEKERDLTEKVWLGSALREGGGGTWDGLGSDG